MHLILKCYSVVRNIVFKHINFIATYYFSKKEKIFDEKEKEKFNVMTMGCEIKLEKVGSRKLDKRIEKKSFLCSFFITFT